MNHIGDILYQWDSFADYVWWVILGTVTGGLLYNTGVRVVHIVRALFTK